MFTEANRHFFCQANYLSLPALFLIMLGVFFTTESWSRENPIISENSISGTTAWKITKPANDLNLQIKGYASATSVNKGQTIDFFVSTKSAQDYRIEIYRMGWYNGKRGRLMKTEHFSGVQQPVPVIDSVTGMVFCPWASNYSLLIPNNWVSGIYLAKLINASGYENYIIFAVRDDNRTADFLYQQPVTTYQAYNAFPSQGIGKSLYTYNSSSPVTISGEARAVKVSFDRPYSGNGAGGFFDYDIYMIGWLERMGYDVTYSTNIDVHQKGASYLKKYQAFLSVGHDEYWTKQMYDAAEAARDAGIHLAFLGANDVYWQIRMVASDKGVADRVIVAYKNANIDPNTDPKLKTILWRDVGRAEQALVGVQYLTYNDFMENGSTNSDFMVKNTNHWVYQGTGFNPGDKVPGIIGYEVDVLHPEYPKPVSNNYTKIGDSFFTDVWGDREWSEASIYQAPSQAWVFAAGTMSWSWGLDKPGFVHPGIQKMTENILGRFVPETPDPQIEACNTYMNGELPITWSKKSVYSYLNVPDQGKITDINVVQLTGSHTRYFKDLRMYLRSPAGTNVNILKKCRKKISDFDFNLDDDVSNRMTKSNCAPDDGKTYKSFKKLNAFEGQESQGKWRLKVKMSKKRRGTGSLNSWGLEICTIQ